MLFLRPWAVALVCTATVGAQSSDWVPHAVIPPTPTHPDTALKWVWPWTAGDVDHDGYADFYMEANQVSFTQSVPTPILRVASGGTLQHLDHWDPWKGLKLSTYAQPDGPMAFLRYGNTLAVAFIHAYPAPWWYRGEMEIWSLSPFSYLATVSLPPPPGSLPAITAWAFPTPAGDVDGDAWDDFGFVSTATDTFQIPPARYGVFGLVDGARTTVSWSRYWQDLTVGSVGMTTGRRQDLDGDGYLDVVMVLHGPTDYDWAWEAVSGKDGQTIWSVQDSPKGWLDRYAVKVPDLDGDGLDDLFIWQPPGIGHPGKLLTLSARDGSLIWFNPIGRLDPSFENPNADKGLYFSPRIGWVGDTDRDGYPEVYDVVREFDLHPTIPREHRVWVFSGRDGSFLRRETIAPDLAPWFPGDDLVPRANVFSFLGDVDGDGYGEMSVIVTANDWDIGGGQKGAHCVLLGRRTLVAPEQVAAGQQLRLDLDIPAGPGRDFQVLLSTAFAPLDGGIHVGRWDTHLADSYLTRQTSGELALRGTLDGKGHARLSFRVPDALRGQTVYARAVVKDPTRPDGVLTLSSVAEVQVLP